VALRTEDKDGVLVSQEKVSGMEDSWGLFFGKTICYNVDDLLLWFSIDLL
jgi:hypothetical protein